jgi:small subunit ribosomal protein S6
LPAINEQSTGDCFTKETTKERNMKKYFYELTYIINPVLEEDQFKETVDKVNKLIEENDGEIDEIDEWGVRKLAYEMDGKRNGYFVNIYFEAPASAIEVIERNMRISDEIMRYLTLKYDSKMLKHYELKKKGELPSIIDVDEEEEEESED